MNTYSIPPIRLRCALLRAASIFAVKSIRNAAVIILGTLPVFHLQQARSEGPSNLASATAPLEDGIPEVAVARLTGLLEKNPPEQEWCAISEKLAEALIAAKRPADALHLLEDPRLQQIPSAKFWRGQALGSLHRPAEALQLYEEVAANETSPFHADAVFGTAEMLRAVGRPAEALEKFSSLFRDPQWSVQAQLRATELFLEQGDTANASRLLNRMRPKTAADRKERHFFRGRLEMVSHWPEKAVATFESILKRPEGANHSVLIAALFQLADAHLQLKTPETGDDVLEEFIEHHPQDGDLGRIFAKLDELYRAERKPARSELERWARASEQPRRAFAQWYLARLDLRAGRRERALELLGALRQSQPRFAELAPALLEFAELELEDRHFDEAIAILNDARALELGAQLDRINLLAAQTQYRAKRFDIATVAFEQVGHSASPFAKMSLFNASLGWLQLGDRARFLADYGDLAKQGGDEESRAELRLEEGLVEAANRDKRASDSLQNFLRDFPQNRRASEAWVALAELAFHASPPRLDEARKDLSRAASSKPTAVAEERGDYLAMWIEDADPNDAKMIELAKRFLERHGTSTLEPEVRMKLAEVYYREQDFADAQTEFEILAEENPAGRFTEKALFFAAESAMASMGALSLDHALVLFDRVVQLNGELKWAARDEEAVIERKLGKPQDALVLYEEVLKSDARPAEKREALCGKGDIFFEMGTSDSKNYQRAVEAYDQLAADSGEPLHWHNQALFKKGVCLEKESDRSAALAAFYTVLENETRPDRPHEFFWFYKAGFNAGRILEADAKWQSAAAVYQRLAAAGGNRSDEARERLDRLRLEHFLWEE
jgi:predicted negative regulator of RcsB-dependent stress response